MANRYSLDLESTSSQFAGITDASQTGLDITGDMTVEAWVNPESFPTTTCVVVSKWNPSANCSYRFGINGSNALVVISDDGDALSVPQSVSETFTTGKWKHVAWIYDASAGSCEVVINGSSVGTATSLDTSIYNGGADFVIGAQDNNVNYFDGLVDDVRVWNDKRTVTEIANNFQKELVGNEAGLVGYWKLDNGYTDETSNSNDLTASGSPVFSESVPFTNTQASMEAANF